ncbi:MULTISPECIES: hypothetical protein [unclassified Acidocella]|uniref:hypothetical protein n=1 Tax=unclassified Acidocella TaxID=2648610 RepID=UPI001969A81A|nr:MULTISPECIES: hypothetical protein [unclassified Acidocella]WBO58723.1 hypothetical protein GT370_16520 [Acidocella sp. MX-AZ03]
MDSADQLIRPVQPGGEQGEMLGMDGGEPGAGPGLGAMAGEARQTAEADNEFIRIQPREPDCGRRRAKPAAQRVHIKTIKVRDDAFVLAGQYGPASLDLVQPVKIIRRYGAQLLEAGGKLRIHPLLRNAAAAPLMEICTPRRMRSEASPSSLCSR